MANEVLYSGIGDLRTTETLSGLVLMLLADRNIIINHPALLYAGSTTGRGSNVLKTPSYGLDGYDLPAATAEGTAFSNTALTDASHTVTPARRGKKYSLGDIAKLTDLENGLLNLEAFARDAVISLGISLTDIVANLMGGFSNTVGTSGVDLDAEDFLDAITLLEVNNAPGPFMAVLHSQQIGDLRKNLLLSSGGALQFHEPTAELFMQRGAGYKGQLLGVDVFQSNRIPTANSGADRAGGIFGRGAILWGDAEFMPDNDPNQILLANGKVLFERNRLSAEGLTEYVMSYLLGASEAQDAAGVAIITDA